MSTICRTFSQIASSRACVWTRVINLSQQSKRFAYLQIIHVLDQLVCVECLTRWAQIITMTMIKIMNMTMTVIKIMIMIMIMTMIMTMIMIMSMIMIMIMSRIMIMSMNMTMIIIMIIAIISITGGFVHRLVNETSFDISSSSP